jgi:hypothetical protein
MQQFGSTQLLAGASLLGEIGCLAPAARRFLELAAGAHPESGLPA